jgi:hypothetical protein
MNSLKMMLVACAFVTVSQRVWSAELQTNEVLTVILELVDGSRVVGTPGIEAVAMQTPYAKVSLPLKQILSNPCALASARMPTSTPTGISISAAAWMMSASTIAC